MSSNFQRLHEITNQAYAENFSILTHKLADPLLNFSSTQEQKLMSKFKINRITKELIRAILRFLFSFPPPTMYENNFQILFFYKVGGGNEKRNLRIALINSIIMRFILNFDISFYFRVLLKSKNCSNQINNDAIYLKF